MNTALTLVDFAAISPLLILLGAALLLLLTESFFPLLAKRGSLLITLIACVTAMCATVYAPNSGNLLMTSWLQFDSLGRFFTIFFLLIGMSSALLAASFFQRFEMTCGEYFFLLLSATMGLILIGMAADFLILFLGLETLSISLYILCGYVKKWKISREASIKYFFIGSLATAFLLYGIALIYGSIGSTRFSDLLTGYQALSATSEKMLFLGGVAFVTLGLSFKAAIVPFHVWAPDVYGGSPTPVTAFMAVGTKVGAFTAFTRVFLEALPQFNPIWNQTIAWLAYPTMIYANIVALRQTQLRRFFAYSGISHAGFLLIPLVAGTSKALPALLLYLIVYTIATLGSFAVLAFLDKRSEGVMLDDLKGLFKRSPFLAGVLSLCLLTLAGLPPTAGFLAKFYLFKVAFEAGYHALVIVGLFMTIFSAFYYLRIIAVMFSVAPEELTPIPHSWSAFTVGVISVVAMMMLSLYPGPLLELLTSFKSSPH